MWLALLAQVLGEVVPKILDKVLKGSRQGFAAVDTGKDIEAVRSSLSKAQAMLDKGE